MFYSLDNSNSAFELFFLFYLIDPFFYPLFFLLFFIYFVYSTYCYEILESKFIENNLNLLASRAIEAQLATPSKPLTALITGANKAAKNIQAGINRDIVADALEKEFLKKSGVPGLSSEKAMFKELIDEFRFTDSPLDIKSAQDLKVKLGKEINWDRLPGADIPEKEKFYRSLYGKIREGVDDGAELLAEMAGGSSEKAKLAAAKKLYGNLEKISQIKL